MAYAFVLIIGPFAFRSVAPDPATMTTTGTGPRDPRGVASVPSSTRLSRLNVNVVSATVAGGRTLTGDVEACALKTSAAPSDMARRTVAVVARRELRMEATNPTMEDSTTASIPAPSP